MAYQILSTVFSLEYSEFITLTRAYHKMDISFGGTLNSVKDPFKLKLYQLVMRKQIYITIDTLK